ncbi:MAG TPA: TonB-dependent receptor [Chitinophagaceae bacterium]|nr:TonB-dependent receptor [Chitinophagaceae bacterium]
MTKRLHQLLVTTLMAFITPCIALAQQNGKVNGSVKGANDKVVEAATVSLLAAKDSALVKMAVSDKNGAFEFENIKTGTYFFTVDAVGYARYSSTAFTLAPGATTTAQPALLTAAVQGLGAVTVNATRPLIENKIDRTVVNVDASPTNTGLTVLEVLERSPGITVDNNDNVLLKGKQGVIIMVDGKPTYLNATDLANLLKSMSANQVDQIEIMTQPPAKYDAAGNSGIINIKTKKTRNNGFNASITTSGILAIYFKQTNNFTFNWRHNKINVYGNAGYSHWEGFNDNIIDRKFRAGRGSNFSSEVYQTSNGRFTDYNTSYKAGLDYFASKNTTFGVSVNGFVDHSYFKTHSLSNFYDSMGNFTQYNTAVSDNVNPWKNIGVDLNMQQKFGTKGAELDVDADYISYRSKSPQYSNNYLYTPDGVLIPKNDPANPNPYLLNGYLPGTIDIYTLKADFSTPLKNNVTFEAGFKSSYVKSDNDAQYTLYDTAAKQWNIDYDRSNHFIYTENINAAYLSLQKQVKKFTAKVGLRAEQTISKGNQVVKNEKFDKNYTRLFPTAYLSYQPNDNNTWEISYGRRIERPDYQDLNPFQFQLDRYTYQQGNPYLQPQFAQNIEVSYNYKGALNITANYTRTTDIINDVLITREDADKNYITYQTKENIASNTNFGLAINYGKQLKKWWNVNVFANVFDNRYKGYIDGEYVNVALASFTGNLSSRFTFNKGWSGEISGFMQGKSLVSSAILAKPMGMFSIGAGKQVLKNKGTIRLNIRDPFYIMRFNGITDMDKFTANIHSVWDNRRLILTFTYRFGKSTGQPQRKKPTAAEEEQNRVNVGGGQQ